MITQLMIGSATILATMAVLIAFVGLSMPMLRSLENTVSMKGFPRRRFFVVLSGTVLLILAANTLCVWIWALLFRFLAVFASLEEAVYFSMVSFTTVGYGDVVVNQDWRVLSGFVAVNGLLAFGIFTAFLIEMMHKVSRSLRD